MVSKTTYRYDEDKNAIVADYEFEDAPAPIRTFSKLKLYGALVQAGLWDDLVSWLQNEEVDGINAYIAFSLAQDLNDAHPLFNEWFARIKRDLSIDDAVAEAILAASEAE